MKKFDFICVKSASQLILEQGGFPLGWNIDSLTGVHTIVSSILHENQDRINDRWSITFSELCRIIQQERAQTKFQQDFAYYQKIEAANKK